MPSKLTRCLSRKWKFSIFLMLFLWIYIILTISHSANEIDTRNASVHHVTSQGKPKSYPKRWTTVDQLKKLAIDEKVAITQKVQSKKNENEIDKTDNHLVKENKPEIIKEPNKIQNTTISKKTQKQKRKYEATDWEPVKRKDPMQEILFGNRSMDDCVQNYPKVIVIGFAKCGTAALLKFLTMHPKLVTHNPYFESEFFSKRYSRGFDWYKSIMPCANPGQMTLMKCPQYLYHRAAPIRIHKFDPNMKFVVIACNPVKRTVSKFVASQATNGIYSRTTFDKAAINPRTGNVNDKRPLITDSLYSEHIVNFLNIFNRSQIHVVDGDRFAKEPMPELIKTERFLGVEPWIEKQAFTRNNRNERFWCLNDNCMQESKGRTHPDVEEKVLAELRTFFKPYNEKFFSLVNQTFEWDKESYW